jgi:O-antigen ligase
MTPGPDASRRWDDARGRWRDAARVLFILAAIGSFTSPPLANIAAALGLAAFALSPDAGRKLRAAAAQPAGIGVLVLLGTMAVAMLWADVEWPRRFASWWSWRPLLLLLAAMALFDDERWKDRFALALAAVLAAAAVASFVVRYTLDADVAWDPGIILRNHTTQGMALVLGIVLAGLRGWARPASARLRAWLGVAIALCLANLALITTGRSAHVALLVAAGLAAFLIGKGRRRWLGSIAIVLVGVAILGSSGMVRSRFESAVGELDTVKTSPTLTSTGLRIVIWETTWELIKQRPVLGQGVGGFPPAYAALIHQRYTGWQAAEAKDTHNQYLHVLVEAGIPGLAAFLAFVLGVFRQPAAAPYRAVALGLFAGWLATSIFNSHFQTFAEAHMIGLTLGVLLAGARAQPAASAAATAPATSS